MFTEAQIRKAKARQRRTVGDRAVLGYTRRDGSRGTTTVGVQSGEFVTIATMLATRNGAHSFRLRFRDGTYLPLPLETDPQGVTR